MVTSMRTTEDPYQHVGSLELKRDYKILLSSGKDFLVILNPNLQHFPHPLRQTAMFNRAASEQNEIVDEQTDATHKPPPAPADARLSSGGQSMVYGSRDQECC